MCKVVEVTMNMAEYGSQRSDQTENVNSEPIINFHIFWGTFPLQNDKQTDAPKTSPEVSEYCFLDRIRIPILFGIRILTAYEYE